MTSALDSIPRAWLTVALLWFVRPLRDPAFPGQAGGSFAERAAIRSATGSGTGLFRRIHAIRQNVAIEAKIGAATRPDCGHSSP